MKRFVHDRSTVDMLHAFENKLSEVKEADDVETSTEVVADEEPRGPWKEPESPWELLTKKPVYDSDGFITDYSLWRNWDTGEFVAMLGDTDLYNPENSYPDMTFDNEEEAYDWYYSYSDEEN